MTALHETKTPIIDDHPPDLWRKHDASDAIFDLLPPSC